MKSTQKIEGAVLPFKVQQLVEIIMQKKSLGFVEALCYLYSTAIYAGLQSEESKLWYMSGLQLYDMMEEEKCTVGSLAPNPKVLLFFTFCIEHYREYLHLPAMEVLFLFYRDKVFDFLADTFDVLHTQDRDYIVSAIDTYLKSRRV